MRRQHVNQNGMTLLEMLVVVTIIAILSVISLPNIFSIIQMNRLRTSAGEMLLKTRFVRDLAIKSRRQVKLVIDPGVAGNPKQTVRIVRSDYTEYNLLENIAEAVRKNEIPAVGTPSRYVLYEEKGGTLCVAQWAEYLVTTTDGKCEYYFAGIPPNNGIDPDAGKTPRKPPMVTDCPANTIVFNPSGTLEATCNITIKNIKFDRQFTLTLYKGGQTRLF